MPVLHLTDIAVRALKPTDGYVSYWDDTTPGFGVRVGKRSKTWMVMRGRNRERISIGKYGDLSLAEARAEAKRLLSTAPEPKAVALTFAKARERFIEENYRETKPRTKAEAERLLKKHFNGLDHRQLHSIDDADVKKQLDKLSDTPSEQLHAFRTARCFFRWCVRPPRRYIKHSPSVVALLRTALAWKPQAMPLDDGQRISQIEHDLVMLREQRRETQARIDSAAQFAKRSAGFEGEAVEQRERLASIKALPFNRETGEWQWPFAEANLNLESPIAGLLLGELEALDQEMSVAVRERPILDAYLAEQRTALQTATESIRAKELELAAAIAANAAMAEMGSRNNAAARVVGRISLFLENLIPNTELLRLEAEERRLKAKCDELERKIGADNSGQRLTSTLNNISMHMSGYISALGAEFSQYPARLDLHHLTVAIDRPGRPILMPRTGGGSNHLAYHLAAMLALHRFTVSYKHPMPQFLLIDQPTQVYFPSEAVYERAGGSIERTEQDADLEAVRRLFELLQRFAEVDAPGFQVIVTEHANLRDPWFQSALVEAPWTKPPALVPDDWPDGELPLDLEPEPDPDPGTGLDPA